MPRPPRKRPGEFEGSGLRLDWEPYSAGFVLDLIETTRLPLTEEFADLPSDEERLDSVVQRLNGMAMSWDAQWQYQARPSDFSVGKQLSAAAKHAEKLVESLPVRWEHDPLFRNDSDHVTPQGTARFAPGPDACNPRLADALQAAVEQHVETRDLDRHEPLLPEEWPADVLLQVRSLASVLRRAAEAHQGDERKEKASSHDAATTEFGNSAAQLYRELFGRGPGVSRTSDQNVTGPWIRFLGKVLREMPDLEHLSDNQLKTLSDRHVEQ